MKILVIFTGGTIGSDVSGGWISPNDEVNSKLISEFIKNNPEEAVEFTAKSPYSILSENLTGCEISALISEIDGTSDDYDGIIVTCGTDTVQYVSTAVSYAFSNKKCPIVFVSSNYVLSNPASNGMKNFEAAVDFIKKKINGVFVSYKNDGDSAVKIYFAERVCLHNEGNDSLFCIDGEPFAFFDRTTVINEKCRVFENTNALGKFELKSDSKIKVVHMIPGLDYDSDLTDVEEVLIKPYHSGTVSENSDSLKTLCKKAKEKNIPVFAVNINSGDAYESTKIFKDLNVISLGMCTFVSAYIKLWIASSTGKDIKTFAKEQINQE